MAKHSDPISQHFLWRKMLQSAYIPTLLAIAATLCAAVMGIPLASLLALLLYKAFVLLTPINTLLLLLLSYTCLVILRAGLAGLAEYWGLQVSLRVKGDLRQQVYSQILEHGPILAPSALNNAPAGAMATLLHEKIESLDGYFTRYIPQVMAALCVPVLIIITLFFILPAAAWALLLMLVAYPFLMAVTGIAAGRESRRQMEALSRMNGLFLDRLRNLPLIRQFGAGARNEAVLRQSAEDFRVRTMAVLRRAFLSAGVLDVLTMAAFVLVVGAGLSHGALLPENQFHFLWAVLLVPEFFAPLRAFSASYHDRSSAAAVEPTLAHFLTARPPAEQGRKPLPEGLRTPSLDIQKVSFTYPDRTLPTLHQFSLRVEGSEFVALTGGSGVGKTTLLHLIMGFIQPQAGGIFLAQQPLDLIDHAARQQAISYLGQRTYLFHGTLADNITMGRTASLEEIKQAVEQAQLMPLIHHLPDGFETIVGERGYGLSGGQAQRVGLARALLFNAPLLLLDEPTAGLDTATAQALMQVIAAIAQDRTVLMVSHDPLALQTAERVVVMEAGMHE